ncbi:alpha/beta-Hydrolases superfamily protein [Rhynchospora pubera]|uniref:Alpha/beta-Hydrolases superfamily protein n=1 Tax=Rhynchospora pubera TaxID=906938 RepID=A0AAV8C8F1_9POAL|nr:alpha/beta-Hydrolases superfamily protein [Rhynchospora pubera]
MPSVAVKLYSVFFKLLLRRRLQSRLQSLSSDQSSTTSATSFGVSSRPEESTAPPNPSFASDGVATKDIHIDPLTSLSIRIFLPDPSRLSVSTPPVRRNSFPSHPHPVAPSPPSDPNNRRASFDVTAAYTGYLPTSDPRKRVGSRRLPVIIQFHGGAFVMGSSDSAANDLFCRRIAKLCEAIVIAVGYRLAPESQYPAAFDDGFKVINWIAKQANLAGFGKSVGSMDPFGASMVEPWLAAHADPSRCVLLGVSCGANIADYVARKLVDSRNLIDPVRVVAQVLMYPFFIGTAPTQSELKLANSYFYDKQMCILAWKLVLPENEFSLDHPAANPLVPDRGPPLKCMPPTLTVVAEHDWMKDRGIAYSEALRKVNVDAPVLEYKDTVHEFATLDILLKTPQAQACAEDVAIWVKKYISTRGHELSY